jgi:transposase
VAAMPHSRFDNTPKGFTAMMDFIKQSPLFPKTYKSCLFCMEHTGVYTFALCYFLETKHLSYVLESPYHLKKTLGIRRGKNDKMDAAHIARYAYLHRAELKPTRLASDKLLIIKNLLRLRDRLVKSKKGLTVACAELKAFAKPTLCDPVSEYTQQSLEPIEETIDAIESKIRSLIEEDEDLAAQFKLLLSVKGVGLVIAAALLVYTAAFKAFDNSRKFATYIGLAPFGQSSGSSFDAPPKVSHLAHKRLKGLISCGAASAMRHDKELKSYFERRIAEGKNPFAVQNAVRNKFIHRIFAVIKRQTPYVELAKHRV